LQRTDQLEEEDRPAYVFTYKQGELFDAFEGAVEQYVEEAGTYQTEARGRWPASFSRPAIGPARLVGLAIDPAHHRISNRYLNKAFGADDTTGEEEAFDEEDEDTFGSAWDLQAGYSTHVAGMLYVRELQ
jgi:hypothetical protein